MSITSGISSETGRSKSFEIYVATSAIAFLASYVATYVYSFYYGRMTFDSQFHPGGDFPGSLVDPAVHNPEKYNVGVHFFGDFWTTLLRSAEPSPYLVRPGVGGSSYPPLAQFIYKPLTWIPYPVALVLFLLTSTLIIAIPFWRALRAYNAPLKIAFIVVGVLLTYPFLFALDRGNNILLSCGLLLFGLIDLHRGSQVRSAVLIALAASIKIFPLFFLLIFVSRRQWKPLIVGVLTGAGVSVLPLFVYQGGFLNNLRAFRNNSRYFTDGVLQTELNHSLKSWFLTVSKQDWGLVSDLSSLAAKHYSAIMLSVLILILTAVISDRYKNPTAVVSVIAIVNSLFLPITYGYTLSVLLLIPLVLAIERNPGMLTSALAVLVAITQSSRGIPVLSAPDQLLNYTSAPLQLMMLALGLAIILRDYLKAPRSQIAWLSERS